MAESCNCDRIWMATKARIFTTCLFREKFADPALCVAPNHRGAGESGNTDLETNGPVVAP